MVDRYLRDVLPNKSPASEYKACLTAGLTPRFTGFEGDRAAAIRFVWSENRERRHLTSSQLATCEVERRHLEKEYGLVVAEMEAEARARQRQGGKIAGRGRPMAPETTREPIDKHERETSTKRARVVGTNAKYIEQAERLRAHGATLPEHEHSRTMCAACAEHR